jgi:Holliday junction resolvase RusA-like endonuclease
LTVGLPPSTNHLYATVRGRRVLSHEAKTYKGYVGLYAAAEASKQGWRYEKGRRLAITFEVYFKDFRRDVTNAVKVLEDSLAEGLGFNDRVVDSVLLKRMPNDPARPRCEVTVEIL